MLLSFLSGVIARPSSPYSTRRSWSAAGHRDLARIRVSNDPNWQASAAHLAGTMASGRYMPYSPSPSTAAHSPHIPGIRSASTAIAEQEKCLSELLAERYKMSPFMPVLPHCYRLLNQEIIRVTMLLGNASVLDQSGLEHGSLMTTGRLFSNGAAIDMNGWASAFKSDPSMTHGWFGSQVSSLGFIVKKAIRVDIPIDKFPTYNFVGRLLGPRGNYLKRVEAGTDCRILIRGRGSIKDPAKEEMMRGKAGYEHLNEPLHILVEAELPVEIIDAHLLQARDILEELLRPVDDSQDLLKKAAIARACHDQWYTP